MDWARILALPDRTVDQELLARNQYLAAENRRLKLSEIERGVLGEIGHGLGRWVRADVATMTRPDAILWLVPQACSAQVRWLEGASRSGQTTHQARGRGVEFELELAALLSKLPLEGHDLVGAVSALGRSRKCVYLLGMLMLKNNCTADTSHPYGLTAGKTSKCMGSTSSTGGGDATKRIC